MRIEAWSATLRNPFQLSRNVRWLPCNSPHHNIITIVIIIIIIINIITTFIAIIIMAPKLHIYPSLPYTVACIKKMHVLKTLFCENMDCAKRIVCDLMKQQILLQIHSSRQTVTGKGRFRQFAEEMHLLTRSSAEQDHIGQRGHYLICPRSYGYCGTVM